jgi:hypothetical protein
MAEWLTGQEHEIWAVNEPPYFLNGGFWMDMLGSLYAAAGKFA